MSTIDRRIRLVTRPTVALIAQPQLVDAGLMRMAEWVKEHRPDCVPESGFTRPDDLMPHGGLRSTTASADGMMESRIHLSDAEKLVELSGRKCYDSFAEKAGQKTNDAYLRGLMGLSADGTIRESDPHVSVFYHAHFSLFFAGVSRKFSHQFIRNYVGSAREEEGAPSQESTRFTHHYGHYVIPPHILEIEDPAARTEELRRFGADCAENYDAYCTFIEREIARLPPLDPSEKRSVQTQRRKEIMEAGAGRLNMSAETSFIWTSNPIAFTKFLAERRPAHADAEMQRFCGPVYRTLRAAAPNLFLDSRIQTSYRIFRDDLPTEVQSAPWMRPASA